MIIATLTFSLYAPWVHSLKEKRSIVKGLIAKIRNRFNVAVVEIEDQDIHQTIVIAVAIIAHHRAQGDRVMDHILNFVENETEAEIVLIQKEFR
ncbi:DUF503 domain-containing protein [Acetobacterium bakii]|uniref:DUF503 domain-containing protein n=1 Tax=Acetobacterium bakii TaxID=52689 RepID=A0A0L6TYI6_9FIRM|nr:DUF503 domain-containing protein [Acetobacterium bakii]KNZ41147.1 hypothetical protein AKG39_13830 [Acetobacterium bakii]